MDRNQHSKSRKVKKQRNMFQREKQDKTSERGLNDTAVSDLTDNSK